MNSSTNTISAQKAWVDEDYLWVTLSDGRKLATPLSYFPRLLHASEIQRTCFEMSGGGRGLHWNELDEDISVEGLLLGIGDQTHDKTEAAS